MSDCMEPQAHPDRCGCQPDAFQIARHSKRLVEQQRERIAALEVENDQLKHRCGVLGLELENANERRLQAERQASILRQHKTDYMEATEGTRKALAAENARLKASMAEFVARHFAEAWSRRSSDAELEQYLSAGIAQLEAERDKLRAELEQARELLEQASTPMRPGGWFERNANWLERNA